MFASVAGAVWIDLNGNAQVDVADEAVQSALVWLDVNGDGKVDIGEPQTHSAADGSYAFTDVTPGDYELRMQPPLGLFQTSPSQYFAFHKDDATQLFGLAEINQATGEVTHLTPALNGLRHGIIKTISGELYGAGRTTDNFFRIDPLTGKSEVIGNTGLHIVPGLAYDPVMDKIYTLGREVDVDPMPLILYEIDRLTGQLTRVGDGTGLPGILAASSLTFDQVNREVILFDNYLDEIIAYDVNGNARKVLEFAEPTQFFNLSFDGHRLLTYQPDSSNTTILYAVDEQTRTLVPLRALEDSLAVDAAEIAASNEAHRVHLSDEGSSLSDINFFTNRMNITQGTLQINEQGLELVSAEKGLSLDYEFDSSGLPVRFCVGALASDFVIDQSLASELPVEVRMSPMNDRVSIVGNLLVGLHMGEGRDTLVPTQPMTFDLAAVTDRMSGVDEIDLQQAAAVTLLVDAESIRRVSDSKTLRVLSTPDDTVDIGDEPWILKAPIPGVDGRLHELAVDDVVLELADGFGWKNPLEANDVNRDGSVSAIDALLIINSLNAVGSRQLSANDATVANAEYIDASGDNFLSPLDALLVINELNR